MKTKEKFVNMCHLISNDDGRYDYWWDDLEKYKYDEDFNILKTKMENILIILNENDSSILNKDIEDEIWDLI